MSGTGENHYFRECLMPRRRQGRVSVAFNIFFLFRRFQYGVYASHSRIVERKKNYLSILFRNLNESIACMNINFTYCLAVNS